MYFAKIEYSFGSLVMERETCQKLDQQVQQFKAHNGQAVFVVFFGVVNHWICVVIHKTISLNQ